MRWFKVSVLFLDEDAIIVIAVLPVCYFVHLISILFRPCSACAKKGFAADQCTDGCEPCRRARVRCEDGNDKPCRRCREMMLNCADGPAGPGSHSGSANTTPALMQTGKPSHRILVGPMRSDDKKNAGYDVGAAQHPLNGANGSFSRATAGGSPSPPATSGNNNQGRTRGSERAKLACVGCRRDNKKASSEPVYLRSPR